MNELAHNSSTLSHYGSLVTGFRRILAACALSLGFMVAAHAAPITGDPVGNDFGWAPNSTNALNSESLVPGREGQVAPYVLFNSSTTESVVLDFFNFASAGIAFFELRFDGASAGTNDHPVVTGDTIHPGQFVANQASVMGVELFASEFVDVRLALGGERDWDFDWVRFSTADPVGVPEPGVLALLAVGLIGLTLVRRRRTS